MLVAAGMVAGCGTSISPAASLSSRSPSATRPAWEERPAPGAVNDAISAGDTIVAVGSTAPAGAVPGGIAAAWTSQDGRTWDAATVDGSASAMAAVARGPYGFVAVGNSDAAGSRPVVWTSHDGRLWNAILGSTAFEPAQGCASTSLEDVAHGGRLLLFGSLATGGTDAARIWEADLGAVLTDRGE